MGYKLCITEKQSVAEDIARVVGASNKSNKGYIEGNGYLITWAMGHLVGLAEPEKYGYTSQKDMYDKEKPDMRKKALAELPIFPEQYKLIVLPNTAYQFKRVKELMHRDDVDYIIDCGDAGAEGHILQWFIRVKAGCKKPVKRFIATDMTDSAIKAAFANLQPVDKYKLLIAGEYCKKKADWCLGMSASRAASLTYNAPINVGRVMSPTLYFVVERYLANKNFKPQTYYTLECEFNGFKVRWQRDTDHVLPSQFQDEVGRITDKSYISTLVAQMSGMTAEIIKVETKKKKQERPQLYNTETLAKDCVRIYGLKGKDVSKIAEDLYHEHKITTYPRTDSEYITTDLAPEMEKRIKDIATIEQYKQAASADLARGLNLDKRIVDDSKVDDHHAIITTSALPTYDLTKLNEKEKQVLHLIISRMLVAFSTPFKYQETSISIKFPNGLVFTASVKVPDDMGFKAIQNSLIKQEEKESDESDTVSADKASIFSSLSAGQKLRPSTIIFKESKTTAPPLLTEADLIDLMARAGDKLGDEGKIMKGKGIGTQATKLATIEKLFDYKYIEYSGKGKVQYIVPTNTGMNVIKVLPPMVYSPALTAQWENKIEQIRQGTMTEQQFMQEFHGFVNEVVASLKQQKNGIDFSNAVCKCPFCKVGNIFGIAKKDKNDNKYTLFFCSNAKEKGCKFMLTNSNPLYKKIFDKNIPNSQMKKLMEDGKFTTSGKKGKVIFSLGINNEDGKYKGMPKIIGTFPNTRKK